MKIEWSRMAVPQEDGYDTELTIQFASLSQRQLRNTDNCFCGGAVAIREAPDGGLFTDKIHPARVDHPNIARAGDLLARWPAVYFQFIGLIDTLYPYTDPQQAKMGENALGSSSHSYPEQLGSIYATVDNPLGLAQALINEMAHTKLRAFGVSASSAKGLILNDPAELFDSPIRVGRKLPMPGVFHDQYSFMHVTALDLEMFDKANNGKERSHILMLLARNVPRMQSGQEILDRHLKTDDAGKQFADAFLAWSSDILRRSQAALDSNGYGPC